MPAAGEDVGAGGSPGAFVVGRWPVGVVEDGFDDAPFLLDGVLAGEAVSVTGSSVTFRLQGKAGERVAFTIVRP